MYYYDKQGNLITDFIEWDKFRNRNKNYWRVKQDYTPNKKFWVSTVWLGIDCSFNWHSMLPNPHPVIFETMVFDRGPESGDLGFEKYVERYCTEQEALAGHKRILKQWSKKEVKV